MSDAQFPSGQWFGFYTYHGNDRRFLMDLVLEFKAGKMTGEGSDGIGLFVIAGDYDAATGECGWKKQYVGRHAVDYKGFRDATGIWGAWTILPVKGGFHIWPITEGERLKEGAELEETSQPEMVKVSEPSLAPSALGKIQNPNFKIQ